MLEAEAARRGGMDEMEKKVMLSFLGAYEEYPLAVYAKAEELYGSFESFLKDGLGVSDDQREELRRRYLT